MNPTLPVLYILMRNDMASMNPGKAMAQASHASNAFKYAVAKSNNGQGPMIAEWTGSTEQGFGTVLVLAVDEFAMRQTVENAQKMGFIADVVHDPTYPLIDGKTVHFIPVDTCAYVFGYKDDPLLKMLVGSFPLHP